jgi:hypothetical protein
MYLHVIYTYRYLYIYKSYLKSAPLDTGWQCASCESKLSKIAQRIRKWQIFAIFSVTKHQISNLMKILDWYWKCASFKSSMSKVIHGIKKLCAKTCLYRRLFGPGRYRTYCTGTHGLYCVVVDFELPFSEHLPHIVDMPLTISHFHY